MVTIPTIDMVRTGKNIEKLRIRNGMSVKDIQKIFGFVTPQAIYKWQHGVSLPTVDNLVILSMLFNVPIEEILIIKQQYISE